MPALKDLEQVRKDLVALQGKFSGTSVNDVKPGLTALKTRIDAIAKKFVAKKNEIDRGFSEIAKGTIAALKALQATPKDNTKAAEEIKDAMRLANATENATKK